MSKPTKFSDPTKMTSKERKKKEEDFMNASEVAQKTSLAEKPKKKKQKMIPMHIRVTEELYNEIHEIMNSTGLTMNAICLEILRPAIKRKLKELDEY